MEKRNSCNQEQLGSDVSLPPDVVSPLFPPDIFPSLLKNILPPQRPPPAAWALQQLSTYQRDDKDL